MPVRDQRPAAAPAARPAFLGDQGPKIPEAGPCHPNLAAAEAEIAAAAATDGQANSDVVLVHRDGVGSMIAVHVGKERSPVSIEGLRRPAGTADAEFVADRKTNGDAGGV